MSVDEPLLRDTTHAAGRCTNQARGGLGGGFVWHIFQSHGVYGIVNDTPPLPRLALPVFCFREYVPPLNPQKAAQTHLKPCRQGTP